MSQPAMQGYPAACKKRAVTLAVESAQPIAPTARALGVHDHTLPTWSGQEPRAARQEQQTQDAHSSAEVQRLRQATARGKEEREIGTKAAASCAQPLPCRTRGYPSRAPPGAGVAGVDCSKARAAVLTRGGPARPALSPLPISRGRTQCSALVRRDRGTEGTRRLKPL